MKGIIFNIQKFSIHDGPGIRTTVFLKGCPLNCRWCANPESKSTQTELLHSPKLCAGCRCCEHACPNGGIHWEDGKLRVDKDKCTGCLSCVAACPTHALTAQGEAYTVEEVLEKVLQDKAFYDRSGGGVTLSGGEPLMQKEFALELLKALKAHGIHTTVETTGYVDSEDFRRLIEYIDLLYMDCKHPDSEMHRKMTDVPNELILANMKQAVDSGKDVVVRIPVIPRFNHSVEVARQYTQLLSRIGVKKVHLLPFHQMGLGKWEALGLEYLYAKDPNMKQEEVRPMYDVFVEAGFEAQIGG
ncbi:glycyl-radical enzyme activating protein [uncultured Ruthenibacterium sp.]|uniref:glycyl-radical enzyme activating protein n=1 Tax=uncultured Ruthenibacterium sp. TaxID=1905347 RepID=UPI00349E9D4B